MVKGRFVFGVLALVLFAGAAIGADTVWIAKYTESPQGRQLVQMDRVPGHAPEAGRVVEHRMPQAIVEHEAVSDTFIVELRAGTREALERVIVGRDVAPLVDTFADDDVREEVVTLHENGPSSNRIDLVFMGDGYTAAEKDKFFADARRLTKDLFEGRTFRSYLPVFNVHAVFRPSNQSGIGKNSPKDTAYGLYREGNTLRAIFATHTDVARRSCKLAPGCDYPILVANDPYYGGLGGEFAITTSSETSGIKVLRHELGHNFGKVGEEYDGGGYFGANTASSVSRVGWKHWLTGTLAAEPGVARFIEWPWHYLGDGAFRATFTSDGKAWKSEIQYSASGIATADTMEVRLDGQTLAPWTPGHKDREFNEIIRDQGFSAGSHEITFTEKISDGDNWLSDLTIFEYGQGYHLDPEYIGAYPLHSETNALMGYRPTHETCLMRNMKSDRFCPVCQENNWIQFFGVIRPLDSVDVKVEGTVARVTAKAPKLGQFAGAGAPQGHVLEVRWKRNGQEVSDLFGKLEWDLPLDQAKGKWEVSVKFVTPEVRKDSSNVLEAKKSLTI